MARWKVEKRGSICSSCERTFEDGELHLSVLELHTEEGLQRRDVCRLCWKEQAPTGAEDSERGQDRPGEGILERFWWGTRHQVTPDKAVRMDMEVLDQLFDALADRDEERLSELRYVICLLLMRKRRLRLVRLVRSPEGESFLVKKPKKDAQHTVRVHDFDKGRMEEVRHELQALLDGAGEDVDPAELLAQADEQGLGDEAARETAEVEESIDADSGSDSPAELPAEDAAELPAEEAADPPR